MKTFFGAVIIGIVLVAGGIFFDSCIVDFSQKMLGMCDVLQNEMYSSSQKEQEIEDYLRKKRLLLASIINHAHIDEIEVCVTELSGYIKKQDYKEANVRCEKLKLLLSRLPEEYGVSLENIL